MSENTTHPPASKALRLHNIAIPEDLHRLLKISAIQSGLSLRTFIEPTLRALANAAIKEELAHE